MSQTPEVTAANVEQRKKLLVLLPGNPVNAEWCTAWTMLLLHLCSKFMVELRGACSNNIYLTRHVLAREAEVLKPDYVLMIDSDNLVTVEAFDMLFEAIEAAPDVSILGAWYTFNNSKGLRIAAGGFPALDDTLIDPQVVLQATSLIEVGYIGFGFTLVRGQVFQDTAPEHFRPILDPQAEFGFMTDDVGFCFLAKQRGHKTFLHPLVRVEHLKTQRVPAPMPATKGEKEDGNHIDVSDKRPELQKLEHHLP